MTDQEHAQSMAQATAGNATLSAVQAASLATECYSRLLVSAFEAHEKIMGAAVERTLVMLLKESEKHDTLAGFVDAIRKAARIKP